MAQSSVTVYLERVTHELGFWNHFAVQYKRERLTSHGVGATCGPAWPIDKSSLLKYVNPLPSLFHPNGST